MRHARRFNETGLEMALEEYNRIQSGHATQFTEQLKWDDSLSKVIGQVNLEPFSGRSRLDFLTLVKAQLEGVNYSYCDPGLWSWLAIYHYDTVRRKLKSGKEKKRRPRYIIQEQGLFMRHLIGGCMMAWDLGGDDFTLDPANIWPDYLETACKTSSIIRNPPVRKLFKELYLQDGKWDKSKDEGRGSIRDFAPVMTQLQVNYCLTSISDEKLRTLLPHRFLQHLES